MGYRDIMIDVSYRFV